jgi:hypothetical protein
MVRRSEIKVSAGIFLIFVLRFLYPKCLLLAFHEFPWSISRPFDDRKLVQTFNGEMGPDALPPEIPFLILQYTKSYELICSLCDFDPIVRAHHDSRFFQVVLQLLHEDGPGEIFAIFFVADMDYVS